MPTIVLIAGSFLGGWVWERVVPELADAHEVRPVTLTGFGDREHLAGPETDLETHVEDITAAIEAADLREVVLVAHSYAGVPATIAASRLPHRIARIVYIAAALPEQGKSLFDMMPAGAEEAIRQCVDADGAGWLIPVLTDEQFDVLWGDHGLTQGDRTWLRARATGHPVGTHLQRVHDDLSAATALPRTYLRCGRDPQDPSASGSFDEVRTLDSGHWPMITCPTELASVLNELAGAPVRSGTAPAGTA